MRVRVRDPEGKELGLGTKLEEVSVVIFGETYTTAKIQLDEGDRIVYGYEVWYTPADEEATS
jgi:hypothetical protein